MDDVIARVAQTHPGIARTVRLLEAELADANGQLELDVHKGLGDYLRRIGERTADGAGHLVIDG